MQAATTSVVARLPIDSRRDRYASLVGKTVVVSVGKPDAHVEICVFHPNGRGISCTYRMGASWRSVLKGEEMLYVSVLGNLAVLRHRARVQLPPSKKTRALLAYLAVTARPHSRDRLCSMFWAVPDDPRAALRWSLSHLRPHALHEEAAGDGAALHDGVGQKYRRHRPITLVHERLGRCKRDVYDRHRARHPYCLGVVDVESCRVEFQRWQHGGKHTNQFTPTRSSEG
jgi:hypothetical protein